MDEEKRPLLGGGGASSSSSSSTSTNATHSHSNHNHNHSGHAHDHSGHEHNHDHSGHAHDHSGHNHDHGHDHSGHEHEHEHEHRYQMPQFPTADLQRIAKDMNLMQHEGHAHVKRSDSEIHSCCGNGECVHNMLLSPEEEEEEKKAKTIKPKESVKISVQGMDCSGCAQTIIKRIKQNKGIQKVTLAFLTGIGHIGFDPELISVDELISQITVLGYDVIVLPEETLTTLKLKLGGPGDLQVAKEFITKQTGVKDVRWCNVNGNQESSCVTCRFTPTVADEEAPLLASKIDPDNHSHSHAIVEVNYDSSEIGARKLFKSIERLGYCVQLYKSASQTQLEMQSRVQRFKILLIISILFAIPQIFVSWVFVWKGSIQENLDSELIKGLTVRALIQWLLATPVQFGVGWPLYKSAINTLWYTREANMDCLVMLSTTTAYVYSVVTVIMMMATNFEGDLYFETSSILLALIMLGRWLEMVAKGRASNVLTKMLEMQAPVAILLEIHDHQLDRSDGVPEGKESEIDIELIQTRDILKVTPGAKIPVDGIVEYGETSVDESTITGESIPVSKKKGDKVFGGTVNQHGMILIKANKTALQSTLANIYKAVQDAQSAQAPVQRMADRVAAYFVPAIIVLSIIVFFVWYGLAKGGVIESKLSPVPFGLMFALSILVISCPCAISLAAPTCIMVATAVGAKFGVIFKGGDVLERCHAADTIIFDKTGTLTHGKPVVTESAIFDSAISSKEFWTLVGSAERGSEHVLGRAIVSYAETQGCDLVQPMDFKATPGLGLECFVHKRRVLVGNRAWMAQNNMLNTPIDENVVQKLEDQGNSVIFVAFDSSLVGLVALADTPKPEARWLVRELVSKNIDVWMISGDNKRTANAMARKLGIRPSNAIGGVLPAGKADKVKELQEQGRKVIMVGDGVNDSPALVQADVGIAVGGATDITLEASDVVLMKDDLRDILTAIDLSRATFKQIRWNFVWATIYNIIGIPLASGIILWPLFHVVLNPAIAGASEILSSVPVLLFSLLLKRYKPPVFTSDEEQVARLGNIQQQHVEEV